VAQLTRTALKDLANERRAGSHALPNAADLRNNNFNDIKEYGK
jgi:hypothetical protein